MFDALVTHVNSKLAKPSRRHAIGDPVPAAVGKSVESAHCTKIEAASPVMPRKSAARYLGVAPQTLAQWASNKKVLLPYSKIGRKVVYRQSDLDAFIIANMHGAAPSLSTDARHA